ncbi:MAG TPA: CrcB family protein [Acidimicrobiales bacterium]|jgi:CrcB protein
MTEPSPPHHSPLDEADLPALRLSAVTLLAVFLGGAFGSTGRYLLGAWFPTTPGHFPWVTLGINLSGSLLIGLLIPLTEHMAPRLPQLRPLVIIGVLGGWTTYSTLAVDGVQLSLHHHAGLVVGYLAATVFVGIGVVIVGNLLGQRLVRP